MKIILDSFVPLSGKHCVSNSLKQIFYYNKINLSEEMIFGLSSGLNFIYFDFKFAPTPIIGGRNKIGEFETNLAKNLNIKINFSETASAKKGYQELIDMLNNGQPAMIYLDMAYLEYFHIPVEYHFGGHTVVCFGIDEEEGMAYISDRDSKNFKVTLNQDESPDDFHILTLENLNKARSSKEKPYPPKNRLLYFDFTNYTAPDKESIFDAIDNNVKCLLNPPIKNIGLKGIKHFANEIINWKAFEEERFKMSAFNCFIMINQVGGNGGGCFRKMFGDFLIESSEFCKDEQLKKIGLEYKKIALKWDEIADIFYKISSNLDKSQLNIISDMLNEIYNQETLLSQKLQELVGLK